MAQPSGRWNEPDRIAAAALAIFLLLLVAVVSVRERFSAFSLGWGPGVLVSLPSALAWYGGARLVLAHTGSARRAIAGATLAYALVGACVALLVQASPAEAFVQGSTWPGHLLVRLDCSIGGPLCPP